MLKFSLKIIGIERVNIGKRRKIERILGNENCKIIKQSISFILTQVYKQTKHSYYIYIYSTNKNIYMYSGSGNRKSLIF